MARRRSQHDRTAVTAPSGRPQEDNPATLREVNLNALPTRVQPIRGRMKLEGSGCVYILSDKLMMRLGKVAAIGFVAAIAVISGLLGFWYGSSQETSAMGVVPAIRAPVDRELVQGIPVAQTRAKAVRLHAGPTLESPVAYTIAGDKIWVGPDTTKPSVYTLEGGRLLHSRSSEIQYTISGNRIYRGRNANSNAVYTVVGHRVWQGASTTGEPLLTYVGNHVHWGSNAAGRMILTANTTIEGSANLEFLLPILLLERF